MTNEPGRRRYCAAQLSALAAAILFGVSTPLAKRLLGSTSPISLAALLYLGAGLGAALILVVRAAFVRRGDAVRAPRLTRRVALALAGAILAGGVAAPIAMLYGLRATPAATASLLLNFEVVATTFIAASIFGEAVGHRAWAAVALITVAGCLLAWRPNEPWGLSAGVVGIVAACALRGLDNNLTRLVSAQDPIAIVCVKGLGAGAFSLALARLAGDHLPSVRIAAAGIALGSVSFGASIALFVRALRDLGAARTGALFGTAPFFGALLSSVVFPERPGGLVVASLPLMAAGAALLLSEAHRHAHHHPEMTHNHGHTHDDGHHDHAHEPGEVPANGYHSHRHRHRAATHDHPHSPDRDHRHAHSRE